MILDDNHSLQLQWDDRKIVKGFQDLEKRFSRLNNKTLEPKVRRDGDVGSRRGSKLSDSARQSEQFKIEDIRTKAQQQIKRLQQINTKEARANINQLERSIKSLSSSQERLKKITNRNSKEFLEYRSNVREARQQVNALSKSTNALTRNFNAQKFATTGLSASLKNLGRSWVSVFAIMAGAGAVVNTGRAFEDMAATLLLSSGSAEQAAIDFEFLSDLSRRLGLDINSTSKAFSKFAVAGSALEEQGGSIKDTFESLSIAIRATGLATPEANLAFLAFQQMLAGPVIQAQEMNQIVERMPQFTRLAKVALKDMGHEVVNIRDTIATGTVESTEFVQRVAQLMKDQAVDTGAYAKSLESVTAQTARLKTALDLNLVAFNEAGFREGWADLLKSLTQSMRKLKPLFITLGAALGEVASILATILDVVNLIATPMIIAVDALNDMRFAAQGYFEELHKGNIDLSKGNVLLNAWHRWWTLILSLVMRVKGHFLIFKGNLTEMLNRVSDSTDPFAFFKSFSLDTEIGSKIRDIEVRSRAEGIRQAGGTPASNIEIKNEFNINGDPSTIRNTIEMTMDNYLQKVYSGGG